VIVRLCVLPAWAIAEKFIRSWTAPRDPLNNGRSAVVRGGVPASWGSTSSTAPRDKKPSIIRGSAAQAFYTTAKATSTEILKHCLREFRTF